MIRIQLSDPEVRSLESASRQATDRKLRDRLRIVLMAHRGRTHQDIAADLGIAPRTVRRWLNRYLGPGLSGLGSRKAKGAEAKVPAELAEEVRRWVLEGPAEQGLDRAGWTHAELAEHLHRSHGIRASRSAMRRPCRQLGIRVYRPTDRFLRGDPEEQAAAREDLAALKAGRNRAGWSS